MTGSIDGLSPFLLVIDRRGLISVTLIEGSYELIIESVMDFTYIYPRLLDLRHTVNI